MTSLVNYFIISTLITSINCDGINILKLRLPREISEIREIDKESTFCATFKMEKPIYVKKFKPVLTEDTNHIALVGLAKHKELNLGKTF